MYSPVGVYRTPVGGSGSNPYSPSNIFNTLYGSPIRQAGAYEPSNIFGTLYGSNSGGAASPTSSVQGGTSYNVNPPPSGYSPIFGGVPGPIGVPNPFQDLSGVYPNLSGTNAQLSADIMGELSGRLSPETQALLQDKGAAFGVSSGMPGSGLARSRTLRDLGLTSEALQQQGISDYDKAIQAISRTQTVSPEIQAEIAARNAQVAAAPIPSQAASYAKQLFDEYLNSLRRPSGGGGGGSGSPSGGTGAFSPPVFGGTPSPAYPGEIDPYAVATQSSIDPTTASEGQLYDWMFGYGDAGGGSAPQLGPYQPTEADYSEFFGGF